MVSNIKFYGLIWWWWQTVFWFWSSCKECFLLFLDSGALSCLFTGAQFFCFYFLFFPFFLTFIKFYLIKYLHSHVCMFMFLSTYVACCVSRGQRTLELDCLFVIWNLRMDSLGKSLLKWKKSTGRLRRLMSEKVLDPTWYGMCMPSSSLKRMLRRLWTNT